MSVETALALIGFAFVMSISPGPSNFLLLASGANFGFARSISLVLGISTGFLTMVLGVGLELGQVLGQFPILHTVLRFLCGAFVVWLALKVARSRSLGLTKTEEISKPISFVQGALFQLENQRLGRSL